MNGELRCLLASLMVVAVVCWSSPPSTKSIGQHETARRDVLQGILVGVGSASSSITVLRPPSATADDNVVAVMATPPVQLVATGDTKQLFNEGRALESQGNIAAAQRIYAKVTKISPRFVYGWSSLGNTQSALGILDPAEESYSKSIDLCRESIAANENPGFGVRKCDDLWVLLLNRGALRLNNGREKDALDDLSKASVLRGKPDALIAQNLARALEVNGQYAQADREYGLAISMTSNEVSPFWLRSALVKFQLGDVKGGFDLVKRVSVRFPEAPEVRAAYATFLAATGDQIAAQQKYLEIPDRPRLRFVDQDYLRTKVAWPPSARETLAQVSAAVGDKPSTSEEI